MKLTATASVLLGAALLLSGCNSTQATVPNAAPASANTPQASSAAPTNDYAQRKANLPQQAPEPLDTGRAMSDDLAATYPGGKVFGSQGLSLNKERPIVFVHGLGGWGTTEFLGVPYWGGTTFQDVIGDLRSQGYNAFQASVGPVSSNWERATELYAQIKGGCVDYGAAYSAHYGFSRFDSAKCYKGFYPQWDAQHPITLLGHSMGGQTVRMLVKLLEDGSPENADGDNLFAGGRRGWVKAAMTVSSPNSGTPAADNLQTLIPFLKDMIAGVAKTAGVSEQNIVYDFDLGQWGIRRKAGETLDSYIDRVQHSAFVKNNSNAAYDLSVDGMLTLNKFIGRSNDTIYASWATSATTKGLITGWAYPTPLFMNPFLSALAWPYPAPMNPTIGNMTGSTPGGLFTYNSNWWENDGLVPVASQGAPLGESEINYLGGAVTPGQWYNMGKVSGWDHMAVIGLLSLRDVRPFFRNQAAWLASLP